MPQPVFLRIPPDLAKRQLEGRIKESRENSHDLIYYDSKRLEWHHANVSILKGMFASDEILLGYNGIAQGTASGKAPTWSKVEELRRFLEQLRDSISGFPILPTETSRPADAAAIRSSPTSGISARETPKWEFHSVIVDDPALGAHIEKPVYGQTLKELAAAGWELVSAVPVIYTEDKSQMFLQTRVEAYRLFFKRPAR